MPKKDPGGRRSWLQGNRCTRGPRFTEVTSEDYSVDASPNCSVQAFGLEVRHISR